MTIPVPRRKPDNPLRARLHEIIFEADTRAGRLLDVVLIWSILLSVTAVMLDSVAAVRARHGALLTAVEWFFTILFTVEYVLRLWCIGRPARYATSFFGVVDLLAIVPTYLSLVVPGSRYLLVIRILRVLRIFRVLKLVQYLNEAQLMVRALRSSGRKIAVFFATVIALGQAVAAVIMLFGFAIIAVPTGIVASEMSRAQPGPVSTQVCPECAAEGHDHDARHCKFCGASL